MVMRAIEISELRVKGKVGIYPTKPIELAAVGSGEEGAEERALTLPWRDCAASLP